MDAGLFPHEHQKQPGIKDGWIMGHEEEREMMTRFVATPSHRSNPTRCTPSSTKTVNTTYIFFFRPFFPLGTRLLLPTAILCARFLQTEPVQQRTELKESRRRNQMKFYAPGISRLAIRSGCTSVDFQRKCWDVAEVSI